MLRPWRGSVGVAAPPAATMRAATSAWGSSWYAYCATLLPYVALARSLSNTTMRRFRPLRPLFGPGSLTSGSWSTA